ncbi:amidase [Marinobacter zhejiangensis]|uniref:Amidase n=1 Tax=Marinobacter zhejiangensis TaxID=488535 RepID=A0A1I4NEI0_9GAMM|nr:amidase [Marinobacter zhejiangensis]SFM13918.1 amidase [Marinobacter zhejiangensis]
MTAHLHPNAIHAFTDDALADHDATALANALKSGKLSAREVLKACQQRADQVAKQLNAEVPMTGEREPVSLASTGAFAGVPTYIKDNTDVGGFPTNHGSAALRPAPCRKHSPFTRQYLDQGMVCMGKSALPEFGLNASTEPAHGAPTRNPWNTAYSSGASSGGSAALVAAGVVPIAHANDGGGSIRIPAACCGLVGLKPSRGRLVDNPAARSLPINILSEGVVTRSVRDTANFYTAAEHHFRNRKLPAIGQVIGPGSKRLRIGVVLDSLNGHRTDPETRDTVEHTAKVLAELGHEVVPMPIPVDDSFPEDFALYWGFMASLVRGAGRWVVDRSFDAQKLDGLTLGLHRMFMANKSRLPGALLRLRRSTHRFEAAMAPFDAALMPVVSHTTPELGYLSPQQPFDTLFQRLQGYVGFTPLANVTGAPAIALPMGLTSEHLPVSVQLMAAPGHDRTLLELAFALEEAAPFPTLSPGI